MGRILTYLVAYGGSALAVFYPWIGLLIYISFAISVPESLWFYEFGGSGAGLSFMVAIALLVGWALRSFGNWDFGRASPIVFCIGAFFFWAVASWPLAQNRVVAYEWVYGLFKIVLPFIVGMTLITSVQQLKQLAWTMVLVQGYVAFELNLSYRQGWNRVWLEGFGFMDNNSIAIGMVTGVGLAFFLGLGAKNYLAKMLAFGCALMMAHVVLFSFSRGGMVALAITGFVGFWLTPRRPIHYAFFGISVAVILALSGQEVRNRFLTVFADKEERDQSADSRLRLWTANFEVMLQNPVFGVGPHQWPLISHKYGFTEGKEGHSLWLQTGAELGFPGLAFLFGFYLITIARLWPYVGESSLVPDPFFRDVARMVVSSLIGFAVAAQFVSITFLEIPYYAVLLGAGVLKLITVPQHAAPQTPALEPGYEADWHSYAVPTH